MRLHPSVPLIARAILWALMLPMIGFVILGAIPVLGWLAVALMVLRPAEVLAFLYMLGFVPSLVTSAVFFALVTRARPWILGPAICLVAAGCCVGWYHLLDRIDPALRLADAAALRVMAPISAIAAASLCWSFRLDKGVRRRRADVRLRDGA